jgi:hypothetical protein
MAASTFSPVVVLVRSGVVSGVQAACDTTNKTTQGVAIQSLFMIFSLMTMKSGQALTGLPWVRLTLKEVCIDDR